MLACEPFRLAKNKKSRVTAAQFASCEAIANTLRSPQLDTKVSQLDPIVNRESIEAMDVEVDTKTEPVVPVILMRHLWIFQTKAPLDIVVKVFNNGKKIILNMCGKINLLPMPLYPEVQPNVVK